MKLEKCEKEILAAYESGELKPVATEDELARIREAARATGRLAETAVNPPPTA
jgi:hypothetical protein